MTAHFEVCSADDAQFGFLEEDHDLLVSEPDLVGPGQKAFYVTTPDGEGTVIIGSLQALREFARHMVRGLSLEIDKEAADRECAETGYELKTGHLKEDGNV